MFILLQLIYTLLNTKSSRLVAKIALPASGIPACKKYLPCGSDSAKLGAVFPF